mmetsp:Transcript_27607/g.42803  ORF Transcript_27607/g.42803 Transcript_27607/m.42803 type:complete len:520 (+) Transcript_27607:986-2545(+)
MAVAVGPSGANADYLHNLSTFLSTNKCPEIQTAEETKVCNTSARGIIIGDFETRVIADMTRTFQSTKHGIQFLFGAGSNQYNQLLLNPGSKGVLFSSGLHDDEVHELVETVLVMPPSQQKHHEQQREQRDTSDAESSFSSQQQHMERILIAPIISLDPKELYAGGGHSAVLSEDGELFLWGWNENGQLGRSPASPIITVESGNTDGIPYPVIPPLPSIDVVKASLGHTHTMILERHTGRVYAFGDNIRGQVTGGTNTNCNDPTNVYIPTTPHCLENECCIHISAGVFHSAVITQEGELMTFGWDKFGRCLPPHITKWRPDDGSKLVQVACGYKHTLVLDEHGRVWSMGDNRCGQLGRAATNDSNKHGQLPHLIDGVLGTKDSTCISIDCGWSHCIALCRLDDNDDNVEEEIVTMYGWGRNDKGQLGNLGRDNISIPEKLRCAGIAVLKALCGSECTMVVDCSGDIWACGWNEHGNLAIGSMEDALEFVRIQGTDMPRTGGHGKLLAVGGAHFIALAKHK